MQETHMTGKLVSDDGRELSRVLADIVIEKQAQQGKANWSGTCAKEGWETFSFGIASCRLVLDDGRSGDITVTHATPSVLKFEGRGQAG